MTVTDAAHNAGIITSISPGIVSETRCRATNHIYAVAARTFLGIKPGHLTSLAWRIALREMCHWNGNRQPRYEGPDVESLHSHYVLLILGCCRFMIGRSRRRAGRLHATRAAASGPDPAAQQVAIIGNNRAGITDLCYI